MANTVTTLTVALGQLLSTLKEVTGGAAQTKAFINFLGWTLPPGLDDIGLAETDLSTFLEKLRIVLDSSDVEWNDELIMAARIGDLALAMGRLVQQTQQLAETLPSRLDQQDDYIARTNIHKELPRRIFDLLVASYLSNKSFLVSSLLHLVNILEFKHFEADEANYQVEHIRAIVHYDHLHAFLSDPSRHMQQTYGWGTAAFAGPELVSRIDQVLRAVGASATLRLMDRRAEEVLLGRAIAATETEAMPQLLITLYEELGAFAGLKAGLSVFALRPGSAGGLDGGIGILPFARGHGEGDIPLHQFKDTVIEFSAHADVLKRIALLIRPGQPPRVKTAHSLGELADGRFAIGIRHGRPETALQTLVTLPGGSSLSFQQFRLIGGMEKREGVSPESFLELGLLGCRLEYSLGEADAFLSESISRDAVAVPFDLRLGWSSAKGIYVHGSGDLHATLPLHLAVGPFLLESLYLALDTKEEGFDVEASTSGRLSLGPLTVTVERLGLSVKVSFHGGNLGLFGLAPGFKPPTGLGLAIDATVVRGGGFLSFDTEKSQYAGAVYLEITGGIAVTGLGLLTTRLPDGKKGFSLVVVITAEGFKPIPLGFGFMLTGIGGLLGIHRTASEEALQAGVRNQSLNAVLAPEDPVRNAPQYLSALNVLFPPARDHHLFGPMVKLTWGTPTLVTINLALVFEFGVRTRFFVLGKLSAILPKPETDLVRLQMNVAGGIDFDQQRAFLDAALYDSRLLNKFVITGEMRMRMSWSNRPFFALAIGGLHPAFTPPPGLEQMQRTAIILADSDDLKIRCEAYVALTSNSVQFGARVDLVARASKFTVSGQAGFDVLVQFDPFYFIASLYASLQLKCGSRNLFKVTFEGELSGPRPLHARGKATFEILWWDYSVSFNRTLVSGERPPLPPATDVAALLRDALANPASWSSRLPGTSERLVSLREGTTAGVVLIHPLSLLTVKQSMVPLNLRITRFGSTPVAGGPQEYQIQQVLMGTRIVTTEPVRDHFAPAQFRDMSDDEKLSSPSFELLEAGIQIGTDRPVCGTAVTARMEYEEIIIPEPAPPDPSSPGRRSVAMDSAVAARLARWSAVGLNHATRPGANPYRGPAIPSVAPVRVYSVVSQRDLTKRGIPVEFSTRAEAVDAMRTIARDQRLGLQIVARKR